MHYENGDQCFMKCEELITDIARSDLELLV